MFCCTKLKYCTENGKCHSFYLKIRSFGTNSSIERRIMAEKRLSKSYNDYVTLKIFSPDTHHGMKNRITAETSHRNWLVDVGLRVWNASIDSLECLHVHTDSLLLGHVLIHTWEYASLPYFGHIPTFFTLMSLGRKYPSMTKFFRSLLCNMDIFGFAECTKKPCSSMPS